MARFRRLAGQLRARRLRGGGGPLRRASALVRRAQAPHRRDPPVAPAARAAAQVSRDRAPGRWRGNRGGGVRVSIVSASDGGTPMSRPLACMATLAVLVLAGCGTRGGQQQLPGHAATGPPTTAGRVTGRLLIEGGP